jgi:hypothetical protein
MTYPKWCCQRCGSQVGYIGRALEHIARFCGYTLHNCEEIQRVQQREREWDEYEAQIYKTKEGDIGSDDIRVGWSIGRQRRYEEIAEELDGGYGIDFHKEIMQRLDAECRELDKGGVPV